VKYEVLSALAIIAYAFLSYCVSKVPHPGIAQGLGPLLLRLAGALSCLAFQGSPRRWSIPLVPQRMPQPPRFPEQAGDPMISPLPPRSGTITPREPDALQSRYENDPRGGGTIVRSVALLVALGLTAWACSGLPAQRRSAAAEVWGQAQDAQVAATVEISRLARATETALVQPRPGRTKAAALADLQRWFSRLDQVQDTSRVAQRAAQGASTEFALLSPPETQEKAARTAWEAARQLQREVADLRAFASQLVAALDVPGVAVAVDGGVR